MNKVQVSLCHSSSFVTQHFRAAKLPHAGCLCGSPRPHGGALAPDSQPLSPGRWLAPKAARFGFFFQPKLPIWLRSNMSNWEKPGKTIGKSVNTSPKPQPKNPTEKKFGPSCTRLRNSSRTSEDPKVGQVKASKAKCQYPWCPKDAVWLGMNKPGFGQSTCWRPMCYTVILQELFRRAEIPVSQNRNEPNRTEGFLSSWKRFTHHLTSQ